MGDISTRVHKEGLLQFESLNMEGEVLGINAFLRSSFIGTERRETEDYGVLYFVYTLGADGARVSEETYRLVEQILKERINGGY